jgi:hypothetical protein
MDGGGCPDRRAHKGVSVLLFSKTKPVEINNSIVGDAVHSYTEDSTRTEVKAWQT